MKLPNKPIRSPLNYTGGKYKLLKDLFPLFPERVDKFVDVFAGGLNVCLNADANSVIANDARHQLMNFYLLLKNINEEHVIREVESRIELYGLSKENKGGYIKFRENYNRERHPLDLFILSCYSFNNQLRFNSKGGFNIPFGERCFNQSIKENLKEFCKAIREKNIDFLSQDFRELSIFEQLGNDDIVYCDPPYLISTATYNTGWDETCEKDLLKLLDRIDSNGIKFALSNVFSHKGNENKILVEWSKKYNVHFIDKNYSNCFYNRKEKNSKTIEVLVTNYETGKDAQKEINTFVNRII